MNLDNIIKADIVISETSNTDEGYGVMLILGPAPKNAGGKTTPDVGSYSSLKDLLAAGFTSDDPIFSAASVAFSQSPKPAKVFAAIRKTVTGELESITDTLNRTLLTNGWYALCPVGIDDNQMQTIANWVETQKKMGCFATTAISNAVVDSTVTRTFGIFEENATDCANAAYLAKFLPYAPGSESWTYKTLVGIPVQSLDSTEIAALEGNNLSYYVTIGGVNSVVGGKTCSGEWIDTIRFCDWLQTQIQQNVYNILRKVPKIPYTDNGITMVQNAVVQALESGRKAGGIADPVVTDDEEIPAYTVSAPRASEIPESVRKSRNFDGIKWSANLAGAILYTAIHGTVTY